MIKKLLKHLMERRYALKVLSFILFLIFLFFWSESQAITISTAKLQVPFIENQGQTDAKIRFYTRTTGGPVFIMKNGEIVYSLQKIVNTETLKEISLKEELLGGMVKDTRGEKKSLAKINYFVGKDPSKWKNNIPTYDLVSLGEVFRGIELKIKAHGDNVEKLFYLKPGANPEDIRVRLKGAKTAKIIESGGLELGTELGAVNFLKPVAYQEIDGKKVEVKVEYSIRQDNPPIPPLSKGGGGGFNSELRTQNPELIYGFKVGSYDRTKELIIDPLLASTFLGGSLSDYANSIALDTSGNVYITGTTLSTDFPATSDAYDTVLNSYDAFVAKFNKNLTELIELTFLGGSNGESGNSIALDSSGNVYVAGATLSTDFPTTTGAYDTTFNFKDVFVSKFNSDLTQLLASTYLGGSSSESATSIVIDSSGNVYVSGETLSTDFPTTTGAFGTSNKGSYDAFVSKFNKNLTTLLASTYLGGNNNDHAYSMALDADGNLCVTGWTLSSNFPTTTGAYDTSYNGFYDVFVSKFNGNLKTLLASTYLGGSGNDNAYSIALDADGNLFITGSTFSIDFPVTPGSYDTSYNSSSDAFVSKFNKNLTTLLASTFLGGIGNDSVQSITVDLCGYVYVAGYTGSLDFPTTLGVYNTTYNGGSTDAFITVVQRDLTSLLASTFLGGVATDAYNADSCYDKCFFIGITLDSDRDVYVASVTNSSDFPTTTGAYDTSYNGFYDVFVSKLDVNPPSPQYTLKVEKGGTGSGTVSSDPVGIDCGSECTATFEACPRVTLTATADTDSTFAKWSGACTGKSACTLTMNKDRTVKATFNTCTYSISPKSRTFYASGGKGTISVTTQSDCIWDAVPSESWITITSGSSGTGSGTVKYKVSANTITPPSSRTGNITVKGKTHTITQNGAINVLLPTAGEAIPSGTTSYTISWEAPAEAVTFKLKLSLDNGITWTTIASNVPTTNYTWPAVPTPRDNKKKCIIKVIGYSGSDVKVGAGSVTFEIQVVKLDSPNGGLTYTSGNPLDITWTANTTKKPIAKVRLLYTKDNGLAWIPIIALTDPAYLTAGSHTYNTTVPSVTTTKNRCKVKVVLEDASGNTLGTDASDNPFTIQP